jgi:hypothetical protein
MSRNQPEHCQIRVKSIPDLTRLSRLWFPDSFGVSHTTQQPTTQINKTRPQVTASCPQDSVVGSSLMDRFSKKLVRLDAIARSHELEEQHENII